MYRLYSIQKYLIFTFCPLFTGIDAAGGAGGGGGRRRLPSLPPPNCRSSPSPRSSMCKPRGSDRGWIQLGLCFEEDSSLIVTLWSAEGLKMMETSQTMALPKPYARVRLCIYG